MAENARYLIFEFLNVPHLPGKMLSAPIAQPDGHKTEDYHNPQMDVVWEEDMLGQFHGHKQLD